MPKERLLAIADRAVWNKVTKERAGIRWDSVVEKVWKNIGGNQEEILSIDTLRGYSTEIKEGMQTSERLALRKKVKEGEHLDILDIYEGLREDIELKTYVHGLMEYYTLNA